MRRIRFTARTRLTLLYAALIAVSGCAVAALIIVLAFIPVGTSQNSSTVPKAVGTPGKPLTEPSVKTILDETAAAKAQTRRELRDRLIGGAAISVGALTAASTALGWLIAGRVLRPVHIVSGTARRLSERDLHERIPVSGPHDEMRELAETFNGMLARLQSSFDTQSRFTANAAHELRGPMTTQRTLVEVAARTKGASVDLTELTEALSPVLTRQERLVDGLLALAWSEHGIMVVEPVRLDETVRAAIARIDPDSLVQVDTVLRPVTVHGDPTLLDLMVDNLVRNAVVHNTERGRIWITAAERGLDIENTGDVITNQRLDTLTEPFRRGVQDRVPGNGGAGLGLTIVAAAVRAHEARLTLEPRPSGGLHAQVLFP